jgi:hypothetical protein
MASERIRLWVALIRCPAYLRLSIASLRTVSSSAMGEVYEQAPSDHPNIASSPSSSPTSPDRSRAVSLVTSFGCCGPIYHLNILSRTGAMPLTGSGFLVLPRGRYKLQKDGELGSIASECGPELCF